MAGLQHLRCFHVSANIIAQTMQFLAAMGNTGNEGLVLWAGTIESAEAFVTEAMAPRQTPIRTETGLAIYVGPETLHDLNVWLHQHRVRLLAQVHSHGEEAYHSSTDDQYSLVTTLGGLSVVVPAFAQAPFDLETCSVHRLTTNGWITLNRTEAARLLDLEA